MENTRTKILDIMRRRGEATVDDLTHALDLAPATVRRHLDILQRDGFISVRAVRRETGRPHYAFSMTEAGEDLFPQHYVRITNRLIDEIASLAPGDTAGRSGQELAGLIFGRMADRIARNYAPRITGRTLGERVEQTALALTNEGIVFDVVQKDDGYLLTGRGCPCRRLADEHGEVCRHDQRLLGSLLDADIEPAGDSANREEAYCAYLVRPKAARALSI